MSIDAYFIAVFYYPYKAVPCYNAVNSFSSKLVSGLSSGSVGLIMGLAGFDGKAEVITASARRSIIALSSWIPLLLFVAMIVVLRFFDLENRLPQIRGELAERKAAKCAE